MEIYKTHTVFANRIKLIPGVNSFVKELLLVVAGSLLIAVCARLTLYLPFSPVPITAQTFAVLVIGMSYGRIRAAITLIAYLAEGASGLPVFAGSHFGIAYLFGPTGGYLLGFVIAAYVLGAFAEKKFDRHFSLSFIAMVVGIAIIFFFGLGWMITLMNISLRQAFITGLLPFIPSAVVSIFSASVVLPLAWRFIRK
ncbi:MAG: biotin transporter BioY [Bacteroidetes bacterium]|nr:biotin transporter BioY [Bacteroidota bacterium]